MNAEQMIELIRAGRVDAVETEWLRAIEDTLPLEQMTEVLAALVARGHLDAAETCAAMLLEERKAQVTGEALLDVAKAAVTGVPISDELRAAAAEIYRSCYGDNAHFEAMLTASGLLSGQSPRRALRTLDTCLGIAPGRYLVNRFDHAVVRSTGYNDALGEFEYVDAGGRTGRLEPKELADEFDLTDDDDFRVLHQHRPQDIGGLLQNDPAAVLIAICKSSGGGTNANKLREMLVPDLMPKDKWAGWWSRARTAAKRSEQLSVSPDRPIRISYHPGGRSLEDELAEAAAAATMPVEKLAVLQDYARDLRTRKCQMNAAFVGPIVEALAEQATVYASRRPGDALAAALALDVAAELGMPRPKSHYPSASNLLANTSRPTEAVASLADRALWPAALAAMAQRDDSHAQLRQLLRLAPTESLDDVAAAAGPEACAAVAAEAVTNPRAHLEVILWLWNDPATPVPDAPNKVELFRRLIDVLSDIEKDLDMSRDAKRDLRQRIRSALGAGGFASYRQVIDEIDEAVAATVLNMIQRSHGLSDAGAQDMINILRERHYMLFITEKGQPWEDANVLWTSEAALLKREDELKYLVDVTMLKNAEAIGAAASHGDLSENSEWKFAIEERDLLRAQAARIQDELAKAKIIHPDEVATDSVAIGSRVVLTRIANGEQVTLSLLGPWDSDVPNHVYNYQTPLALSLLGKVPGDEATLKLGGEEQSYRIERVSSALAT